MPRTDGIGMPCNSSGKRRLLAAALLSRLVVCVLMLVSELVVPDWDDGDPTVARFPAPRGLRAFARWDAAWFLLIARDGYTGEESHAFFPGLPTLLWALTPIGAQETGLVLIGMALSNASFVSSVLALQRLGIQLGLDERLVDRAALLYCVGPASVFHSSIYSESPFAFCTFGGLCLLMAGRRWGAAAIFALGTAFRSNGIVNAGFLGYHALWNCAQRRGVGRLLPLLAGSAAASIVLLPYIAFEAYGYMRFCGQAEGRSSMPSPQWCADPVPSLYGHVQRAYWGNGFLKRWEPKQLPAFLIAAPALTVALGAAVAYARNCWALGWRLFAASGGLYGPALLPHVVHLCFLAVLAFLAMHVQITTRLLSSASPIFHFWLAHASLHPRWGRVVLSYIGLYLFLGVLLHPNCLPWT